MALPIVITRTDMDAAGLRARPSGAGRECGPAHAGFGPGRAPAAWSGRCCGMGSPRQCRRPGRLELPAWRRHAPLVVAQPGTGARALGGRRTGLGPGQTGSRPDLAQHGVTQWQNADLVRTIEARFGVVMAERSISDVLRRLGFGRLLPRPRHPGPGILATTQRAGVFQRNVTRTRSPARARPRQALGAVVAERGPHRPAGHAHLHLGQAW